jgi:hypothetical protein
MDATATLRSIRRALIALSALLFVGSIGELIAVKHYGDTVRLIPFTLCGIGLLSLIAAVVRPTSGVVLGVRVAMVAIAAGSAFGLYEHLEGNAEFYHEIHTHAARSTLIKEALTGRNPIMAPGVLAVAAFLVVLVTFASEGPRRAL